MKEKILTSILILFTSLLFSQENLHKVKLNLSEKSGTYQIIDDVKKELTLITTGNDSIKLYKFNSDFKVTDSIETNRPSKEFESIVGYSISNDNLKVFWSTLDDKKVCTKIFNFSKKETIDDFDNLSFEKEYIIKKITVNNVFYMISTVKNTSILKFYIFPADSNYEIKKIDCSNLKFYGKGPEQKNLYNILTGTTFEPFLDIETISSETPASLVLTSKKRKLYLKDNSIIFSFDINPTITQLLKIDLNDFSFKQEIIPQPEIPNYYAGTLNSNSFLIDDKLFQIKLTPDKFILSLTDSDSSKSKQYEAFPDTEVTFKNSNIIQENGSPYNIKISENSSQFVSEINKSFPAVTCFIKNDKYITTIGSVGAYQAKSPDMGGMFGALGALMSYALTPSSSLTNLNSYKNRKVVYINSSFDKDFNHSEGKVQKSAFDTARAYAVNITKQTNLTIFKFNSILYIGSFDIKTKTYTFKGFID